MTDSCIGLSCEPLRSETLSVCMHGNPINFGRCLICYPLFKPDPIKELRNRIESLHEFKLRQCDENIDIKKRVEEVIKLFVKADSLLEDDIIKLHQSREAHSRNHKDIFERLDNLEKLYQSSTEMESHLLNRVKDLESAVYKLQRSESKIPRMCPVCDGKGSHKKEVEPRVLSFEICIPCEGKGIVWG
jgi:predicted Zn-ribbon and HTH transcriptional regulator